MTRTPRGPPRHPRYSIQRRLGSGGSSTVYLARDLLDDGREVALKVCHLRGVSRDLLGEFRILRDLRHPGIARAFDFGRMPGTSSAYFTLEYVAGPDLETEAALLRRVRRPDATQALLGISVQIVSALEYLHRRGLLHLDLKPGNVVLSSGRAKLIDFGLFQNAGLEAAGVPRGTAWFTAPEVFDGHPVDRRTDLYSLGVTLYRAFTGQYPIRGRTLAEIADAHRRLPPRPPRGVPTELGRIILKLLAKSPEHRFQSAAEVGRALREILADGSAHRVLADEPELTGRKDALDAFFGWFEEVRKGNPPRLLLIEGEAGAGKSRFAETCVTEMLGLGARIISLGSFGGKDAPTLEKLIAKALVLQPATRAEKSRHRFLFTSLGLQADPRSRSEILDLDLEQIRGRTYHEAVDLLGARAADPLIFVIDDADHADARLLDFLRRWTKDPWLADRSLAAGILATSRQGSRLAREVDDPSGRGARRVRLPRLTRDGIVRALRSMDPEVDRATAGRMARRCRGNPGLAVQCLQGGESTIDARAGREAAGGLHRIREEIQSLEPGPRSLLLHVSLLERPADETFLRRITDLAPAALAGARLRLEKAGLLRGSPRGLYLGRRVPSDATDEFTREEIRAAHERIGLRLLDDPRSRQDAAHHLLAAEKTEEGLRAAEEAGRDLRAAGRVEEAMALYSEALASAQGASCWRFLEELGWLEEKSGQFDEAAKRYEEMLSESGFPARDRPRILRKLGGVELRRGVNAAAERAFEEALQLLEGVDDIEEHLHLLNEISALYLFRGEYSRASNFANRGLELLNSPSARQLSREARAFHALNLHSSAGHIFLRQFEYGRATDEFLRGLRFAEEIGSLSNAALILNNLGIAYNQSNRLRKALQVYARASSISRRLGDGTTFFSILCNVAAIRARMGEMQAAGETFREIEEMPPARRSRRARLFLLHSRGLVEKLALKDARSTFEESVRIAEDLPDPLFARYGRLLLFENEIHHGRWASARRALAALEKDAGQDPRLERALSVRRAYLEALCGRIDEARALLGSRSMPGGETHYADLWDRVYLASALVEIGALADAEVIFESVKRSFDRSSQPPGSLECALRLADLELRARDREGATLHIKEARRILSLHDTSAGSRGARVWIPFLEARAALLAGRPSGAHVSDRLVDAAGNLSHGATAEVAWLIDLVASEQGQHGASRRLAASRRRFASLLAPADRKAYLSRNHRIRLGLAGAAPVEPAARRRGEPAGNVRYEALLRLRHVQDASQALDIMLAAAGARRGAIFLEGRPPVAAARGLKPGKSLVSLRLAALRARNGRAGRGLCASFLSLDKLRSGVIYIEPAEDPPDSDLSGFLEVASQMIGIVFSANRGSAAKPSTTTPTLLKESTETQALGTADLVTASPRMREIVTLVHRTRDSRLAVLITGESGSGKDHLARWIHSLGPSGKGPFVAQDCSAIPAGLLEAEIFGYEAGAFTGAERAKTGYLFTAEGGTFYLDNVDSLPLDVQAKLLRVLEEEAARPLGGGKPRSADVRFMASSQRNLKDLSSAGEFRKDLYFRLAGITIDIPPLRERAEDIALLVEHFQRQLPGGAPAFTPGAIEAMKAYAWPGNVRELESMVRRLALATEGDIDETRIAKVLRHEGTLSSFPRWFFEGRSYDQALDEVKREYLLHLFERFEGNLDRIASELGTTKRNVYLRFSQAGIRPVDLRQGPG